MKNLLHLTSANISKLTEKHAKQLEEVKEMSKELHGVKKDFFASGVFDESIISSAEDIKSAIGKALQMENDVLAAMDTRIVLTQFMYGFIELKQADEALKIIADRRPSQAIIDNISYF